MAAAVAVAPGTRLAAVANQQAAATAARESCDGATIGAMRHKHKPLPSGYRITTLRDERGVVLEGHTLVRLPPDDAEKSEWVLLPTDPRDLETIADVLYAVAAYLREEPVGSSLPRIGPAE